MRAYVGNYTIHTRDRELRRWHRIFSTSWGGTAENY